MPINNPSLDTETFEDLLKEAIKNLPVYSKSWSNYNEADPGITLLELLCFLADNQNYQLNRISEKNYLKFLHLLGDKPRKPTPAKLNISLPKPNEKITFPKGTRLITEDNEILFETESKLTTIPVTLKKILTSSPKGLEDKTDLLENEFLYGFGKIPKNGNSFLLGFDTNYNKKEKLNIGITLDKSITKYYKHYHHEFENNSGHAFYPSCVIQWKYLKNFEKNNPIWEPLSVVEDSTLSLRQNGIVSLNLPFDQIPDYDIDDSGEKLKWILCVLSEGSYEMPPKINSIQLNTINAVQGWSTKQTLGSSNGLPDQSFEILDKPLIHVTKLKVKDLKSNKYSIWNQVEDFDSSGPDDKHYRIDVSGPAVIFGNGEKGDIPESESEIIATFRYGTIRKDLDLNAIKLTLQDKSKSIPGNYNHTIISSGKEPEDIDTAIKRTRYQLRHSTKAVNMNDYENLVKNTPGVVVERVTAVPDSKNNLVNVIVIPKSSLHNPVPTSGFLRTINEYLNKHRMLTTQIKVSGPNYIQVSVSVDVEIQSTVNPSEIKKKITDSLNKFLNPASSGNDKLGWKFGRPVFRSEIYAVIKNIYGVQFITKPYLQAHGKRGTFRYETGKIWIDKTSTVYPGNHSISIRNLNPKKIQSMDYGDK